MRYEERKKRYEKLRKALLKGEKILCCEPCDCGSHIRHNNGGNYHDEIAFAIEGGNYFVKEDTTCELTVEEWREVSKDEFWEIVESCSEYDCYNYE